MAYDPSKDMVYITGGTSLNQSLIWDMITYSFATNKWNKIPPYIKQPAARYGHYSFMYNKDLYIYGGISYRGGIVDLWKYNGTGWTMQQPSNPEKLPSGSAGPACVVVTNSNSTKLYVFGGLTLQGETTRDLNVYDMSSRMWKRMDHQNSVGLSAATAVYHQATDSIYYFGGMVNHTTRNVITYQYRISQDLWYALAPRIDPLTSIPVQYYGGVQSSRPTPTLNPDEDDPDNENDNSTRPNITQYLPPVMYDPVTSVWTPAALMGDDSVVMFGGMRPHGSGVDGKDFSCFPKSFSLYDLSCQKWTTYNASELQNAISGRVNHTMILRPPGSSGGSKTAWTAFIFGGFDGTDHGDMLNITLNVVAPTPATINSCRALRWCTHYDDCQYCNPSYCSYVNGLCLFDTDKAKNSQYLVGSYGDMPRTGTIQDLIRQRPDLKSQVQSTDTCPYRVPLTLGSPYYGSIQEGQELTFSVYVDAHDLDIQYEIRTLPTSPLIFRSLNVWEGYLNMYWRADRGLTDDTWNGTSGASSPTPTDVPVPPSSGDNVTIGHTYRPVIAPGGTLNVSELLNRWTKFGGLDPSPSLSALLYKGPYIYFPAADPRRFSGYYVFSLTNRNPTALTIEVMVSLLDHPQPVDKDSGTKLNIATLALFILGFILAGIILVYLSRKIRQLIEDREASHRAAEMQLLEEEEEERRNGSGLHGGMTMIQADGTVLFKKPMYKIVVGVQDPNKRDRVDSILRRRIARHSDRDVAEAKAEAESRHKDNISRIETRTREEGDVSEKKSPVKSDFIRDIGSGPRSSNKKNDSTVQGVTSEEHLCRKTTSNPDFGRGRDSGSSPGNGESEFVSKVDVVDPAETPLQTPDRRSSTVSGIQRGWSLKSLSRVTSFKRQSKPASDLSEKEALTYQEEKEKEEEEQRSRVGSVLSDSELELMDLGVLTPQTDILQGRQEQLEKHQRELELAIKEAAARRNPNRIQPISIEPIPFHGGLVPRTLPNLKRYQRYLAWQKQQQQQQAGRPSHDPSSPNAGIGASSAGPESRNRSTESNRNNSSQRPGLRSLSLRGRHPVTSVSQRMGPRSLRTASSQGSLRELRKVASRITLRTTSKTALGDSDAVKPESPTEARFSHDMGQHSRDSSGVNGDTEVGIELQQFVRSGGDSLELMEHRQPTEGWNSQPSPNVATTSTKRKPVKMKGRREYEPGPLLGMNYLIVFPGDEKTRRIRQQGDTRKSDPKSGATGGTGTGDESKAATHSGKGGSNNDDALYDTDMRLPPMAIGTVFVPDPVRWWAYKAKRVQDRLKFERRLRRLYEMKEREKKQQQQQMEEQEQGSRTGTRIWNLRRPQLAKTR
ncbi:Multiple epidermal growth factor-like domains protein 8 [Mortierella sp. GBA43]|nr:Multiple epidermal growth factor-like domains protein 8 [Mortierella sp. GBA43]